MSNYIRILTVLFLLVFSQNGLAQFSRESNDYFLDGANLIVIDGNSRGAFSFSSRSRTNLKDTIEDLSRAYYFSEVFESVSTAAEFADLDSVFAQLSLSTFYDKPTLVILLSSISNQGVIRFPGQNITLDRFVEYLLEYTNPTVTLLLTNTCIDSVTSESKISVIGFCSQGGNVSDSDILNAIAELPNTYGLKEFEARDLFMGLVEEFSEIQSNGNFISNFYLVSKPHGADLSSRIASLSEPELYNYIENLSSGFSFAVGDEFVPLADRIESGIQDFFIVRRIVQYFVDQDRESDLMGPLSRIEDENLRLNAISVFANLVSVEVALDFAIRLYNEDSADTSAILPILDNVMRSSEGVLLESSQILNIHQFVTNFLRENFDEYDSSNVLSSFRTGYDLEQALRIVIQIYNNETYLGYIENSDQSIFDLGTADGSIEPLVLRAAFFLPPSEFIANYLQSILPNFTELIESGRGDELLDLYLAQPGYLDSEVLVALSEIIKVVRDEVTFELLVSILADNELPAIVDRNELGDMAIAELRLPALGTQTRNVLIELLRSQGRSSHLEPMLMLMPSVNPETQLRIQDAIIEIELRSFREEEIETIDIEGLLNTYVQLILDKELGNFAAEQLANIYAPMYPELLLPIARNAFLSSSSSPDLQSIERTVDVLIALSNEISSFELGQLARTITVEIQQYEVSSQAIRLSILLNQVALISKQIESCEVISSLAGYANDSISEAFSLESSRCLVSTGANRLALSIAQQAPSVREYEETKVTLQAIENRILQSNLLRRSGDVDRAFDLLNDAANLYNRNYIPNSERSIEVLQDIVSEYQNIADIDNTKGIAEPDLTRLRNVLDSMFRRIQMEQQRVLN